MKRIFLLIISMCLLLGGCTQNKETPQAQSFEQKAVKSVWVSYFELEKYTSSCSSENEFRKDIASVIKEVKAIGLNTLTVQVHPCADAFYKSELFPTSEYCFGEQGSELIYDPLQIIIEEAHNQSVSVEAWFNPYRVSQDDDIESLCDGNIAKQWYNSEVNASNVYVSDKIYFNPASEEVINLIVNGIKEIVQNYDVDGIHFDDYFYPTTDENIDEKEFKSYIETVEEPLSLDNWRRDNVSRLIKSVYIAIKAINPEIKFGISPQSKVSVNYNNLYADVEKWASEEGYCDYICPQIYFGFYNETQPFTRTAKEWNDRATAVALYIGLPLYKAGCVDEYASADQDYARNEFVENNNIISRQISYINQLSNVKGYYIYSLSYLLDTDNEALNNEVKGINELN